MWMDFLELEPHLKAMPGKMERGGAAFKVRGFGKRHNFFLVLNLYDYFFCCHGRVSVGYRLSSVLVVLPQGKNPVTEKGEKRGRKKMPRTKWRLQHRPLLGRVPEVQPTQRIVRHRRNHALTRTAVLLWSPRNAGVKHARPIRRPCFAHLSHWLIPLIAKRLHRR